MDDFSEKLNQIIGNPGAMAQILSLAQSLGGAPKDAPAKDAPPKPPPPPKPPIDDTLLRGLMQLAQEAGRPDEKQEALLCALKPYISPAHRERLDRAMQLARLAKIAGFALKQAERKERRP